MDVLIALRMLALLALALALIFLCSCCPQRIIERGTTDSVRIEIREREVLKQDTVVFEIERETKEVFLPKDSVSTLSTKYAISIAKLQEGLLYHSLENIPQKINKGHTARFEVRDSIIYQKQIIRDTIKIERDLSWFQNLQLYGFWVLLILISLKLFVFR